MHFNFRFCLLLSGLTVGLLVSNVLTGTISSQQSPSSVQSQSSTTTPGQPQTPKTPTDDVVRITTQLVQIDVVVTDKKDEHVDDLKPEDFELSVDGKKQDISYFSLVRLPEPKVPEASSDTKSKTSALSVIPTRTVAPENVRRTIAFVVDDLGLSFDSSCTTRDALRKFVDEQMQEGDLVAIILTGRGLGALQQFTTDKRVLYAAIEKLRWNPYSRSMVPQFGQSGGENRDDDLRRNRNNNDRSRQQDDERELDRIEDFRETVFTYGTLGALNFVVRGMRELPGRKLAILMSDGFPLFNKERNSTDVLQRVRRLVDLANRSSVVIYSLDAKGLLPLGPTATDDLSGMSPQQILDAYHNASQALFESQDGLSYIARETGGFAVLNQNHLHLAVNRVLRDNRSYYLLGFDPEDEQFNGKFHEIKVRLKKPGLKVRTRAGYFGVAESEAKESGTQSKWQQIMSALFSPFGARDLELQMTSFFFNTKEAGSVVRSLFHIDPKRLTFVETPEGKQKLLLDIAGFAFDEKGIVIESQAKTITIALEKDAYELARRKGLDYQIDTIIKKPGAYQFKGVVRDTETGQLGSAGQFVQIPDLNKKRLAVSGLMVYGGQQGATTGAQMTDQKASKTKEAMSDDGSQPTLMVRSFARGSLIEFFALVYNARLDKVSSQPKLSAQFEIYHDGKPIFQGVPRTVEKMGTDFDRIIVGGQLRLNGLKPGDYLMHLIVTDSLAKPKHSQVEQWIDFSVR